MALNKKEFGMLILRVALGAVFAVHGWDKLENIEATLVSFSYLGLSSFLAYLVTWAELLSGLALIAGVFTNIAGYLIAAIMAFAMVLVKFKVGFVGGYEFDLILFASALAVAFHGAGPYSLSGALCGCGRCLFCGAGLGANEESPAA